MREENQEDKRIRNDPPTEENWVVTILEEEQLSSMSNNNDKLQDLCRGHVSRRAK